MQDFEDDIASIKKFLDELTDVIDEKKSSYEQHECIEKIKLAQRQADSLMIIVKKFDHADKLTKKYLKKLLKDEYYLLKNNYDNLKKKYQENYQSRQTTL